MIYYLFTCFTYSSIAMVMDGIFGIGAWMSRFKPASSTALWVVGPNAAMRVLFCRKEGKLRYNDLIPEGLKNAMMS